MKRVFILSFAVLAMQAAPAQAFFHDDFESGFGNWSHWTDATAGGLEHVQDDWKSIDPGPPGTPGGHSARHHNNAGSGQNFGSLHYFGQKTGALQASVYIFEDLTNPTGALGAVNTAMTLSQDNGSGQPSFSDYLRIGVLGGNSNSNYSIRTATGGYVDTGVARKSGFTKLGIEVDAPGDGGQVRFFIDDNPVGTSSRAGSYFSIIALGKNFGNNAENFWYDGVNVVPEPASIAMLGLGGLALVGLARRRRSA